MSLSVRGQRNVSSGALFSKLFDVISNPYDEEHNPDGFINLGNAENVCALLSASDSLANRR